MRQWYFNIAELKPTAGFEFEFNADPPGNEILHRCRVNQVVPGRKIAYSWRYPSFTGISLVEFEVIPEGGNKRVRVTHSGLATFPEPNPDLAREDFVEGWKAILGESPKN